ncbi:hypothetical protein [Leadbettera azotonutricia]|uniref:hypothetical protein n=1 Tax=Leadbettera azotonutricia TaxID=150829 RepID=UPI001C079788|nr:hypothetical protein [Leadbettera azotonutricia]
MRTVFTRRVAVSTTDNEGMGSFREALANALEGDIITLPANGTITLTSVLPVITRSVTIMGNGATLTQSGFTPDSSTQLLYINSTSATVKISQLYFKGGRATSNGGAIYKSGGTNTLTGNLFFGNTAPNYNVVYSTATSGGYNVSDKAAGTASATGSGYASVVGDLFDVTDITFDAASKPASATDLKTLTTLPPDFPEVYFDGTLRTLPATAGAAAQ